MLPFGVLSFRECLYGSREPSLDLGKWFTVSADIDGGYRETQFFTRHYNTGYFNGTAASNSGFVLSATSAAWGHISE
jgi:hypothetical protein